MTAHEDTMVVGDHTVVVIYPHDDSMPIDRSFVDEILVPTFRRCLPGLASWEVSMGGTNQRHQASISLHFPVGTHVRGLVEVIERIGRVHRVPYALPADPVVVIPAARARGIDPMLLPLAG